MTRLLLAGAAALGMMTTIASAQSMATNDVSSASMTRTTTTTTQYPVGPVVIGNWKTTGNDITADGDRANHGGMLTRFSNGDSVNTTVTTRTYPLTAMITTIRKTDRTVNGVTTETVETTNSFPDVPGMNYPPPSTTTTSMVVSAK